MLAQVEGSGFRDSGKEHGNYWGYEQGLHRNRDYIGVRPQIMENQMEKKMDNAMEIGCRFAE